MSVLALVIIATFGLVIGSFLNVLIYRLPRGQTVVNDRSRCVKCHKPIQARDLIPLLSWFWLSGRCRFCHQPISLRYPAVELLAALLLVGLAISFSPQFNLTAYLFWSVVSLGLLVIVFTDFNELIIPDKILIALAVVALLYHRQQWSSFLWPALVIGGIFALVWLFTKRRGLGLGDVKLGLVLGLIFGYPGSFMIVYAALLLGSIWGIALLVSRRGQLKTPLPFGMLLATVAVLYIFSNQFWLTWTADQLRLLENIWH